MLSGVVMLALSGRHGKRCVATAQPLSLAYGANGQVIVSDSLESAGGPQRSNAVEQEIVNGGLAAPRW